MADDFSGNFVNPAYASPDQIAAQRQYAKYLTENQMPVTGGRGGWSIGLANALSAGMGGYEAGQADKMQRQAQGGATDQMTGLIRMLQGGGANPTQPTSQPQVSDNQDPNAKAISGIESGGKYDAQGPVVRSGDRAYGKYQVMGNNVPAWTQEILGKKMTPQEFLADPQAQEKVFSGKFGQYLQQTGNPQDAASMWFSGKPASQSANLQAHDPSGKAFGPTGSQYVSQFNGGLGAPPTQVASLGNGVHASQGAPNGPQQPQGGPQNAQGQPPAPQVAQASPQGPQGLDPRTAAQVLTNPWMPAAASKLVGEAITPQFGVIGQDMMGPVHGFINPMNRTVSPATQTGAPSSGALQPNIQQAIQSGASGDEFLSQIPKPMADQVKAMVEGRLQMPGSFALKTPYWQTMLQMAAQYDPGFDATKWSGRLATTKDFSSGKAAQNVTSLNTVLGHMSDLKEKGEALGNYNNIPLINQDVNAVKNQVSARGGDPRLNNFNLAANAVSDELAKVFRSAGMSDTEIHQWRSTISPNASPDQLKGFVKTGLGLLDSRLQALGEQYSRGMGKETPPIDLLNKKSKEVLDKLNKWANTKSDAQTAQPAQSKAIPWVRKPDGSLGPAE